MSTTAGGAGTGPGAGAGDEAVAPVRLLHPRPQRDEVLDDEALLDLYAHAPGVLRVDFVATADGSSVVDGGPGSLGGQSDARVFSLLRRVADVVVVGAGTTRDAGYGRLQLSRASASWRRAAGLVPQPRLAVVSRSLRLDPADALFTSPVRPLVLTSASADAERRRALEDVADVVTCGEDDVDPHRMRTVLEERDLPRMLCEGGPAVLGHVLEADALDELCLTVAPELEGGLGPRIATRSGDVVPRQALTLEHVLLGGHGTLLTRWSRDRTTTPSGGAGTGGGTDSPA